MKGKRVDSEKDKQQTRESSETLPFLSKTLTGLNDNGPVKTVEQRAASIRVVSLNFQQNFNYKLSLIEKKCVDL